LLNHVTRLQAGVGRSTVRIHVGDDESVLVLLDADAERGLVAVVRSAFTARRDFAFAGFVELHRDGLFGAVALDDDRGRAPGRRLSDMVAEAVDVAHGLTVERQNNVASLQTRVVRRAVGGGAVADRATDELGLET